MSPKKKREEKAKAKKPGRKGARADHSADVSESRSILDHEEGKSEQDLSDLGDATEDDDLAAKFGFKWPVTLDMEMPTGDHELIHHYQMQFIDRNPFRGGQQLEELN